ncbi:MocR-like pyridoxine biosynthesis transcription factor PdxR [Pseudothauera nasutitermitis]|uniref:MocR-like pyridoxine biosynthesis transcription factor PdxR n=1 Tax=Pseudothauera nasutitermitis TaxID=2565930 RepID=UPI001454C3F3|nr:PLP-dependent aminotransferase family protein [Pseudothauera nasutitermitis]
MKTRILHLPLALRRDASSSLQEQIASEFRRLIEAGILPPGESLVSIREFSETYGVSRNTVVLAYQRLADEGYIETRPGTLARVARHIPVTHRRRPAPSAVPGARQVHAELIRPVRKSGLFPLPRAETSCTAAVDFQVGVTAPEMLSRKLLSRYTDALARGAERLCAYQSAEGMPQLRSAIAQYVAINKGIQAGERQIVIVNGAQEGLSLLAHLFLHEHADVWMEHPGYHGTYNIFSAYGARIHLQDVDGEGMILDGMPAAGKGIAHVTPAHQYPLGVVMTPARRAALVAWAQASGSLIIENDYDGDFCYEYERGEAQTALASLAPGNVVHLGSFSKALGPGFRLGYMICPPALVDEVSAAKSLLNTGSSWFEQTIVAEMMNTRAFGAHLRRMRSFYMARRDALLKVLAGFGGRIEGAQGAMHLCWTLPPCAPAAVELRDRLMRAGIRVYTMDEVAIHRCPERSARSLFLGYARVSLGDIAHLHAALRRIFGTPASTQEMPASTTDSALR